MRLPDANQPRESAALPRTKRSGSEAAMQTETTPVGKVAEGRAPASSLAGQVAWRAYALRVEGACTYPKDLKVLKNYSDTSLGDGSPLL